MWQLTGLTNWIITLIEKVMKECILFSDVPDQIKPVEESQDDLFGPAGGELTSQRDHNFLKERTSNSHYHFIDETAPDYDISPTLLHLVHPFALQNLTTALKHVRRYHQYLKSASARVEKSQIAKDLLVDTIECSGLNLEGLEVILDTSIPSVEALPRTFPVYTFLYLSSDGERSWRLSCSSGILSTDPGTSFFTFHNSEENHGNTKCSE